MITFDDVQAAARRLDGVAHRTPVITSSALDEATGAGRVLLKAENLQRVGAFKFRGAYNAVSTLSPEDRRRGVATVSSGNHAQAVSLAARLHEIPAVILMPEDAPAGKLAATRGYGAEVVPFDRYAVVRDELLEQLVTERGLTPIHPYDNPYVMAGQGTVALELIEDAGPLDVLLVCLGGGGLLSGCATATAALSPDTRIIGVEPEAGDDFVRSLAAGERIEIEVPRTIADGQQTNIPGELTFPVIQKLVDEVITVSDEEIVAAMKLLFERAKVVAEPSGACAFAALLAGRVEAKGLRVGVTISGGNVTAARFAELVGDALSVAALAMVLASAVLHAGWNALVAGAKDTHATAAVAMLTGVVVFAIPAALTWRVRGGGVAVHRRLGRARARLLRAAGRDVQPRGLLVRVPRRARIGADPRAAHLHDRARRGHLAARDRRHPRGHGRGAPRARRRHGGRRQDEPAVRARRGRVHRGLHARRRPRRGARGADPVLRDRPAAVRDPVRARRRSRAAAQGRRTAARSPPAWAWPAPTSSCWPRSNARPPPRSPRSGRRASCSPASGEDGGGSRARRSSSRASPRSCSAR